MYLFTWSGMYIGSVKKTDGRIWVPVIKDETIKWRKQCGIFHL
jgi:hypothetical protein